MSAPTTHDDEAERRRRGRRRGVPGSEARASHPLVGRRTDICRQDRDRQQRPELELLRRRQITVCGVVAAVDYQFQMASVESRRSTTSVIFFMGEPTPRDACHGHRWLPALSPLRSRIPGGRRILAVETRRSQKLLTGPSVRAHAEVRAVPTDVQSFLSSAADPVPAAVELSAALPARGAPGRPARLVTESHEGRGVTRGGPLWQARALVRQVLCVRFVPVVSDLSGTQRHHRVRLSDK